LNSKAVFKKIVSHPMSTSTMRKRFLDDDDVLKLVIPEPVLSDSKKRTSLWQAP
jgi:hypothetical protein